MTRRYQNVLETVGHTPVVRTACGSVAPPAELYPVRVDY